MKSLASARGSGTRASRAGEGARPTKALLAWLVLLLSPVSAQPAAELRFCLRSDPRTFDPQLVDDESSEALRYLTGGVLIRLNRSTQELEPALAASWRISDNGRRIDFKLRPDLKFSDGTPLTADDVAWTMRRVFDPALHSPVGDTFRSGPGDIETHVTAPDAVSIRFPARVSALALQFDQMAIQSRRPTKGQAPVAGPFFVADYKAGDYVLLRRNEHYWKHDASGRPLPYVSTVRLDIQQNRDLEALWFRRGRIQFIGKLDPELYELMERESPGGVHDSGASLDWVQLWFNQAPAAPIAAVHKAWFASTAFRRAISYAVDREAICRVVYRGHAQPAAGPVSPSNRVWFNASLRPDPHSPGQALALLAEDGFRRDGGVLRDRAGNAVEFSIVTNSGNRLHERILAMIQQDLADIGIRVRVVMLDFPSLIERMTKTLDYDACLLPLSASVDPSDQMNVWLSSGPQHQWNPGQAKPATPWEAEVDRLMRAQASATDDKARKAAWDRVQQIVHEQVPFIFLVHPDAMCSISAKLRNAAPALIWPQVFWNADQLAVSP